MKSNAERPPHQQVEVPPEIEKFIPYGRQWIDEDDIRAIVAVLGSDWLTTGPQVETFEREFADFVKGGEAVAVSSGTAALHAAVFASEVGPGDEVIVPSLTFVATANVVLYQGGTPIFSDVQSDTLLMDPADVEAKLTQRSKAIIAVDYAGQPCDYEALRTIAERHGLILIADACHSLGGSYKKRPVGSLADLNCFSFHPVKAMTTGEGGMVTTGSPELAQRIRVFRNHGITSDHHHRRAKESWSYEMSDLGYNYRITDFQCALGLSQLRKLPQWVIRRNEIAQAYDHAFGQLNGVAPLVVHENVSHAYHLYVVRFDPMKLRTDRAALFHALRSKGIGVNVHYSPVYLHPFYRKLFDRTAIACPVAEAAYDQILSLPVFPGMSDAEVDEVVGAVLKVVRLHSE